MARPLIGITCGSSALDPHAQTLQDRLNAAYTRAVWETGGAPIIVPNGPGPDAAVDLLPRLDGLLLSGGYDVAPGIYGQEAVNTTVEIDAPRDSAEMPLVRAALASGIPLFCICRGIQSLNVALGGTLIQDIPSQYASEIRHRQTQARDKATHTIEIEPDSLFAQIVGDTSMRVNTFHHQALDRVAPSLRVTARAPDGIIEAVETIGARFLLAVQFHPEEMVWSCEKARRLFEAFMAACRLPARAVTSVA